MHQLRTSSLEFGFSSGFSTHSSFITSWFSPSLSLAPSGITMFKAKTQSLLLTNGFTSLLLVQLHSQPFWFLWSLSPEWSLIQKEKTPKILLLLSVFVLCLAYWSKLKLCWKFSTITQLFVWLLQDKTSLTQPRQQLVLFAQIYLCFQLQD